ncbi:MAG TPA: TRAP transporter substrate-binding protein [Anaerohalosphaeraceae bacterium]|nr:TRAP transporter substrate-binding protein [Anaerohalosphaeraceae bacterium]HPP56612.1 TRAP transporter substrate-binding protein [Anaerohalosphaeraceae bacterium]
MRKGLLNFICVLLVLLGIGYAVSVLRGEQEVRVLRLAHSLSPRHPVHITMEYMAKLVEEKSGGRLIVQIFPNEQLGSEKEQIEALQIGYMSMTKTSTAPMESFVPQIRIFGIPYLFRDSEHFWKVAQGPIGKKLLEAGADRGLKGLCYYDAGARSFYAKKPIYSPEDLKGLKVRVMQSIMSMQMIETMGGSPTPIAWGELYTSLDQGVVDAAENNPPSFETSRHFEVCRYYILDEHVRVPDMLVISTRVWESLTPEQQRILQEAVDESVVFNRKLWAEAERASLEAVKAAGVTIIEPDKALFQQAVKPMWERYKGTELGELIEQIQEIR